MMIMFGRTAISLSLLITLTVIHKLNGFNTCSVFRNARDNITPLRCLAPVHDVCQRFDAIAKDPMSCKCICPRSKGTYMENTQKCTAKNTVWSGCSVRLKGPSWSIPVFPLKTSTAVEVIVPTKFRRCRISIETSSSNYLDVKGWKKINPKEGFPFRLSYERKDRKLKLKLKWTKSQNRINSVVRLGIKGCKRVKTDCLLFKVFSGRMYYPCLGPIPTTALETTIVSTKTNAHVDLSTAADPAADPVQNNSSQANLTQPSFRPSVVVGDKNEQGSSSDGKLWLIVGPIIGVVALLIVVITVMVLWFLKIWKKKLKNKYTRRNGTLSLLTQNSTPLSPRQETYAPQQHPYQDLRPPVRGAPPGVYQSLTNKAKEDAGGYLLPVFPNTEASQEVNSEPIYNEIGSPRSAPTYDYALPEDTVRLSIHSLNDDLTNGSAYVGRPSGEQEGPNSNGAADGLCAAPAQCGPSDEVGEPGYLELNGMDSLDSRRPVVVNAYQEPRPWGPREHNATGDRPPGNGPYQDLGPPNNSSINEPLRNRGNDKAV